MKQRQCIFCNIVAHRSPATIRYEDDDVIAFDNLLQWVPVMLLVVPKQHLSQSELWTSPIVAHIAAVGAQLGASHCPGGFRLLSNFGRDAMQSQEHGHLHVIGGIHLGPYA